MSSVLSSPRAPAAGERVVAAEVRVASETRASMDAIDVRTIRTGARSQCAVSSTG